MPQLLAESFRRTGMESAGGAVGCLWKRSQLRGVMDDSCPTPRLCVTTRLPHSFPEQPLQLYGRDGNYDGFRHQRSNSGDGAEPWDDGSRWKRSQRSHPALQQQNICLGWRAWDHVEQKQLSLLAKPIPLDNPLFPKKFIQACHSCPGQGGVPVPGGI